jgi:hypothetical protein
MALMGIGGNTRTGRVMQPPCRSYHQQPDRRSQVGKDKYTYETVLITAALIASTVVSAWAVLALGGGP